jgi:hypothetical protein
MLQWATTGGYSIKRVCVWVVHRCGAFGGDVALKSMLQWCAASAAGVTNIRFHLFQDPRAALLPTVARQVIIMMMIMIRRRRNMLMPVQ